MVYRSSDLSCKGSIVVYKSQGRAQGFVKGSAVIQHRRAKCELGGGGGGGGGPNIRVGGGGGGGSRIYERGGGGGGPGRAGDPCVSPHTSGVKVPPTVPFNLSFATGDIFNTLRTYLKKSSEP